jgi:hypothetical protein
LKKETPAAGISNIEQGTPNVEGKKERRRKEKE